MLEEAMIGERTEEDWSLLKSLLKQAEKMVG